MDILLLTKANRLRKKTAVGKWLVPESLQSQQQRLAQQPVHSYLTSSMLQPEAKNAQDSHEERIFRCNEQTTRTHTYNSYRLAEHGSMKRRATAHEQGVNRRLCASCSANRKRFQLSWASCLQPPRPSLPHQLFSWKHYLNSFSHRRRCQPPLAIPLTDQ